MTDPLIAALVAARRRQRTTLLAVAESAGLSESTLTAIEAGRQSPTLRTLRRHADALGVDLNATPKPDIRISQPGGIWPTERTTA